MSGVEIQKDGEPIQLDSQESIDYLERLAYEAECDGRESRAENYRELARSLEEVGQ